MEDELNSSDNFYGESAREDLVDNDEISAEEEGFMKGYDEADSDDELDLDEDEDPSI